MKGSLYVLVAAVFLFAACSDDSSSTATQSATGASGEPVELNGTYSRECAMNGSDSNDATLVISSTNFTVTTIDYIDVTDCSGTSTITEVTGVTGFTVGDEVSVTLDGDDVTATAWTGTITTFTVTASDDAAVAVVNSSDDYGGTEFEAGVTEDFIEHVDEPDLDQTLYVDDTGESTVLYIGEGDVLDPNEAWTK